MGRHSQGLLLFLLIVGKLKHLFLGISPHDPGGRSPSRMGLYAPSAPTAGRSKAH